jgi:hypothetical protein
MFHHSNLRLGKALEDSLLRVIVTPRMHGIHHSNAPEHQNSNWSGGFTIWDAIHGTLNVGDPPEQVEVGVRGFNRPEQVTLPKILIQPFRDEPAIRAFLGSASPDVAPAAATKTLRDAGDYDFPIGEFEVHRVRDYSPYFLVTTISSRRCPSERTLLPDYLGPIQ